MSNDNKNEEIKLPVFMNNEGLTPKDYKDAIMVQDACNLSGVVKTFARIMDKIWVEARKEKQGTEWVNKHPISILYAEKILHLTTGTHDAWKVIDAWKICEERGKK